MNVLQLYRCRALFEKEVIDNGHSIEKDDNGLYIDDAICSLWLGFHVGFDAALADKPPVLSQQQIIDLAMRATFDFGYKAPNPYERNSAEFRYWQDGCRMGEGDCAECAAIANEVFNKEQADA